MSICVIHISPLQFGVEVRLSQFTLTKLVIFTPYYLLVNETDVSYEVIPQHMVPFLSL